jgi:tripartite-type tricarboxylate transporter receptor subunit TctC
MTNLFTRFAPRSAIMVAALIATVASPAAQAQEPYPNKPVSLVVAFPPGGTADLTARPLSIALQKILKQPFVVENKPGAGGGVGNAYVAKARPD